ncbi:MULTISPECIES: DUF2637 domain-containing protein [unclassified Pseudoclavibacter]|uniref:DUF2637 domain-containing protein n=1 Tax=unclassified Pseudoclavibacter TaxID=2615177 RepID=UPI001BA7178C|nr:DUF2637 domain-containing protein [Pseudoclavibacter sp. Marseille-Q4354]MBS3177198.1 DUF2637 domain-containing protein [Pseudoclavibacter sp. Marseille-Q4354]
MSGVSVRASSPVLAWTVAAGVVVLAGSSFALSFSALAELAVASGVPEHLAFLWPVIVDGFIVVATLAAFSFSARPGRVQLYPWMALGVFAIVSVAGNALHVQTLAPGVVVVADWIAVTVASVPPVALLIASHLLVVMISGRPDAAELASTDPAPSRASEDVDSEQLPDRLTRDMEPEWTSGEWTREAPTAGFPEGHPVLTLHSDWVPDAETPTAADAPAQGEADVETPDADMADFLQVPERFSAQGVRQPGPVAPAMTDDDRAPILAQSASQPAVTRAEAAPSADLELIRDHEQQGGELTAKAVAVLLNVSERTGRRKLAQYRELSAS